MKKLIKNYTTTISVERTIAEIQKLLAENGARGIATEYDENGHIKDVFFKIIIDEKELPYRLPVKTDKVVIALQQEGLKSYTKNSEAIAWRICKTWLEAQITLINLQQAKIDEIFLPYLVMPNQKSLYEHVKENQYLLGSGEK
jgi:tRNA nucleotidyltransferase/poly(A) polymerase